MKSISASLVMLTALAAPAPAQDSRWGAEDLRKALADWLRASGREPPSLAAIGPLDPRMSLPACEKLEIAPRGGAGMSFTLRCAAPVVWQYVLRADSAGPAAAARAPEKAIDGQFRVVVPKVDLPAGATLTEADLEERAVSVAPGATALKSVAEAAGLRLTSSVSPGVAITHRHVARAPAVAKGENVTLVANGSGFEISVPGRAEQDGYEGDVINVRNIRSGTSLKGRVERGKVVSVLQL